MKLKYILWITESKIGSFCYDQESDDRENSDNGLFGSEAKRVDKIFYRKLISNGEYFISACSRICQFLLLAGQFDWSKETMVP